MCVYIGLIETNKIKAIKLIEGKDLDHTGKSLFNNFETTDEVNKLIELGTLYSYNSNLGEKVNWKIEPDFSQKHILNSQCVAFHRDLDQELEILEFNTLDEFNKAIEKSEEYCYMFEDKTQKWLYLDHNTNTYKYMEDYFDNRFSTKYEFM